MRFNYLKRAFSGWQIQKNVIKALIYRELKTKISKARFGLLGVLIEPFVTLIIYIFFLELDLCTTELSKDQLYLL